MHLWRFCVYNDKETEKKIWNVCFTVVIVLAIFKLHASFISLHLTKTDKTKLPHNYWRWKWRLNIDILTSSTWQPILKACNELHSLIKLSVQPLALNKAAKGLFTAILCCNGDVSCAVMSFVYPVGGIMSCYRSCSVCNMQIDV